VALDFFLSAALFSLFRNAPSFKEVVRLFKIVVFLTLVGGLVFFFSLVVVCWLWGFFFCCPVVVLCLVLNKR